MLIRSLESLVGGCVVYAVVAACSGAGASQDASQAVSGSEVVEGGQPSSPAKPGASGPVPDAMAAGTGGSGVACGCEPAEPKEPMVVEAKCEALEGSPSSWAIAEFPGVDAVRLSGARALVEYSTEAAAANKLPTGFASYAVSVYIRDGGVAATCGPVSAPGLLASRVRFILP